MVSESYLAGRRTSESTPAFIGRFLLLFFFLSFSGASFYSSSLSRSVLPFSPLLCRALSPFFPSSFSRSVPHLPLFFVALSPFFPSSSSSCPADRHYEARRLDDRPRAMTSDSRARGVRLAMSRRRCDGPACPRNALLQVVGTSGPPAGRGNSVTSASPHVRYDTTCLATRDNSQGTLLGSPRTSTPTWTP